MASMASMALGLRVQGRLHVFLQNHRASVSLPAMESHEWNEKTDEGKRFYRENYHGQEWRIITTLKTDPDWEPLEEPSEEVWRELRKIVWKKYQRKRCPWERVASIDKILGDDVPE
jgi:hypothetical protein